MKGIVGIPSQGHTYCNTIGWKKFWSLAGILSSCTCVYYLHDIPTYLFEELWLVRHRKCYIRKYSTPDHCGIVWWSFVSFFRFFVREPSILLKLLASNIWRKVIFTCPKADEARNFRFRSLNTLFFNFSNCCRHIDSISRTFQSNFSKV